MARPQSRATPATALERRPWPSEPLPVPGRPTTGLRVEGSTSLKAVGVVTPPPGATVTAGPASTSFTSVLVDCGLTGAAGLTGVLVGAATFTGVDVDGGLVVDVGSGVAVGGGSGVGVEVSGATGMSVAVASGAGLAVAVASGSGVAVAVASGSGV